MLLQKGYLIPAHLTRAASELITHYDEWLEAYYDLRENESRKEQFVFTYNFPRDAEREFLNHYHALLKELHE